MIEVVAAKQARILRLSRREEKLLAILESGPYRVSELKYKSDFPRMTVYSVLNALITRGFVKKEPYRRSWRYRLINDPVVTFLDRNDQTNLYRGARQIASTYETMFRRHASQRVYAIQSAESWERVTEILSLRILNRLNQGIKENQNIVYAVVSKSILELSERKSSSWKRNMEGRTTGVTIVPDEILPFAAEVWIFSDLVLVSDWKKEVCHVLAGTEIVALFKALFESLQRVGKRFDTNEMLRAFFAK